MRKQCSLIMAVILFPLLSQVVPADIVYMTIQLIFLHVYLFEIVVHLLLGWCNRYQLVLRHAFIRGICLIIDRDG